MPSQILTFPSFTRARLAQEVLARHGIHAAVLHLSADARERGCAFGLSLPPGLPDGALSILRREGISWRAIRDRI